MTHFSLDTYSLAESFKRMLILVISCFLLTGPAAAASNTNVQAALNLYQEGRVKAAADQLQQLAEDGIPEAKYYLSSFYEQGIAVDRQLESAFALCADAAKTGLAIAQTRLGWFYQEGIGVSVDLNQAVYWYELAAQQNEDTAQLQLGVLLTGKPGVKKDFERAKSYFVAAAKQGNVRAAHNAGIMYQMDIRPAGQKSPRWSATKEALRWFTHAAEQGYAKSQFELGNMYALAIGLPRSYEQAMFWYTLAGENGHPEADKRRFSIELNLDAAHRAKIRQRLQDWRSKHE